jgi:hypothetical protein
MKKAIKLSEENLPVIAETISMRIEALEYILAESEPCYLVIEPAENPLLILEHAFHEDYRLLEEEKPGHFAETVERRSV